MALDSMGLITWWNKQFYPAPERCLNWFTKQKSSQELSLGGLSGAFLVLAIGHALAFAVFILEHTQQ